MVSSSILFIPALIICVLCQPQDTPPSAGAGLLYSFSQFSVAANRSTNLTSEAADVTAAPSQYIVLQFAATVIVTDVKEGREYSVSEVHSVDAEATRLTMEDPHSNATNTCSYHSKGGWGHSTTGVRCRTSRNFPEECFCWDRVCAHPYLPLHKIFMKLKSQGEEFKQIFPGIFMWSVDQQDMKINATFKLVMNRFLYPLNIEVAGFGYSLGSRSDSAQLTYAVILFQPETGAGAGAGNQDPGVELQPPPGIFCPRTTIHPPQTFPDFPNQFSVNIETVDNSNRVSYSQHHYNLRQKLVSIKFSPRPQGSAPSIFLTHLTLSHHLLPQSYNIIHDFGTGLQYSVSERTGNCSVQSISPSYADAAKLDGRSVRLKLAWELLEVSPHKFVFAGKRQLRGIPADVWVAEKLPDTEDGPYSTIEIFFADPKYTVQIEEVNDLKLVPLGMVTHLAESSRAAAFHSSVTNHYYHFTSSPPHWRVYDISSCVPYKDRLYLKLNLQVIYSQLIQFSLTAAQDSIQAAIASEAHVSSLRIVDIFLSSASQTAGVDVWFVLLQKPKIDEDKEPDLDNAYDALLATFEADYQISLQFGAQRRMLVTVTEGSLQQVQEAVHPAARSQSYLSLRATYTVGSMAGLGFSMAVVGLSIGIFVGFILWKGRLGLPYYYCSPRTPILRSPMADLTDISDPVYPLHPADAVSGPAYPGPPPPPSQSLADRY